MFGYNILVTVLPLKIKYKSEANVRIFLWTRHWPHKDTHTPNMYSKLFAVLKKKCV